MSLVNETLRPETETFPHFSETETRPRRWENASRDRLETETSRPRLHPCSADASQFITRHQDIFWTQCTARGWQNI